MSENKDTSESTKFGTITSLLNNPLATDPNESEQPESKPNEILTNIIKDSNKIINQENQDFDNENIQEKIHGLIDDLKSESIIPDDQHLLSRKSLTSGHLIDNQESNSTPIIDDSSTEIPSQSLIRSMSESIINDQHDTTEYTPTLPIQQDESSTEDDDDDDDDDDEDSNRTPKQNDFDEKRVPSSNKTDTNRANEEIANISRQTSRSKSPLNGPRSPTREDSQKTSVNTELPNAIISPPSRRESTNKSDQQQTSESLKLNENSIESSTNDFQLTNEQSKLIKSGEQLQIPINDINNERINSPPPSPSTSKQILTKNPLLENNRQDHSRPSSQINRKTPTESSISNEKLIDGDIVSSKSRRSSNASQQRSIKENNLLDEKSLNKKDNSRRSSTDNDVDLRTSAKKTTDQTGLNPIRINSNKSQTKHSSITDSENEKLNNSKLPRVHSSSQVTTPTDDKQTKQIPIRSIQTTDDEIPSPRPQSPNVEQIAERNPPLSSDKKKKEQKRTLRRSNSFESFNYIPLVDDKSLDSTSGNNTETEHAKQRRVKSKKKDMETNTDSKTSSRNGNHQQQQQQESTSQKSLKSKKSIQDDSPSTRRRLPTKEMNLTTPETEPEQKVRRSVKKTKDLNEDNDPVNVNVTVLAKNLNNKDDDDNKKTSKTKSKSTIDHERQTQSDSEQLINEKQKKRRRPKRISRTTQTYECVFRRMEREQHEELRPISDLDKNMQTKKSHLRPRTRSPRRHYPIRLSTDAFKIEEILPKQFPQTSSRNQSKTSIIARSNSPQNGKLLILRPTLPFHHTDAVNVQRISLQYAIDLIPNKSSQQKQLEQTNTNLPMIRSTSNTPTNRSSIKDKGITNKNEDRLHQRKDGGYN